MKLTKLQAKEATRGFTLVELIIYLAIVSVLATSLILWSLTVNDLGARSRLGVELNASGRFALEIITRDIEQAAGVTIPASAVPSPTLVLVNTLGETVTINVSNGQLIRVVALGNPISLTASPVAVTGFNVARETGQWSARNSLAVTLTLQVLPAPPRTFTTLVNLRY